MSGSSGEKTEQPTAKRLRDSRKKGQVAKSKEIISTVLVIGLFGLIWGLKDFFLQRMKNMILLPVSVMHLSFDVAFSKVLTELFNEFILISLPFVFGAFVLGLIGNMGQFGFLLTFDPLKPDIKKINPVEGAKKFFKLDNIIELVKSIAKVFFLGYFVFIVTRDSLNTLVRIPYMGLNGIFCILGEIFKKLMLYSSLCFIVLSIFDHFFQKYSFIKKNKMTKDEVKRENKESEGNPEIKSERKKLHREMINSDTTQSTKKSTVIVTNPTHFAVGVYYKQGETPLPVVTVKGVDMMAKQVIQIAESANVPIYQDRDLARALYFRAQVEDYIPADLLKPIAAVLRWIYQTHGRA